MLYHRRNQEHELPDMDEPASAISTGKANENMVVKNQNQKKKNDYLKT